MQIKIADKSKKFTAIPELLRALASKEASITIDAMGCQHDIAAKILESGANYVLGVKDNQPGLARRTKFCYFAQYCLNMLKSDITTKLGTVNKQLKVGWTVDYFGKLLGLNN